MTTAQRHVLITDNEYELPYSKGLMATRFMATGLHPARAYHVAELLEGRLHELGRGVVTNAELNRLACVALREQEGDGFAESFGRWLAVNRLDLPLVVLLGGATGVGKSTVATMLAARLGITRVIPTDAIREVMRAMFSAELFPTLHTSSFDAARLVHHPLPRNTDPVIIGFTEQAQAVAVGITALINRAIDEGTDLIVEGAHVVPGFFEPEQFKNRAVVVPLVISVEDEELHRSHFARRAQELRSRPVERYLDCFDNIRKLQQYVQSLAVEHGVPNVASYDLDATLSSVIDLVFRRAVDAVPHQSQFPTKRGTP